MLVMEVSLCIDRRSRSLKQEFIAQFSTNQIARFNMAFNINSSIHNLTAFYRFKISRYWCSNPHHIYLSLLHIHSYRRFDLSKNRCRYRSSFRRNIASLEYFI